MNTFFKNKIAVSLTVIATLILAATSIFTAIKIYSLRQRPIAPTAPESRPQAVGSNSCTGLAFNLATPTTPTITSAPTLTPSPTPTSGVPTFTPTPTGLVSTPSPTPSGEVSTSTPTPTTAISTSTPTPTLITQQEYPSPTSPLIAQASPTTGAKLPEAGNPTPTLLGLVLGALVIISAVLLAF